MGDIHCGWTTLDADDVKTAKVVVSIEVYCPNCSALLTAPESSNRRWTLEEYEGVNTRLIRTCGNCLKPFRFSAIDLGG